MSTSNPLRCYEVNMFIVTHYKRHFMATSKKDAVVQAERHYEQHGTVTFENHGSEPDLWEADLADE
jgi:hypothetical protein